MIVYKHFKTRLTMNFLCRLVGKQMSLKASSIKGTRSCPYIRNLPTHEKRILSLITLGQNLKFHILLTIVKSKIYPSVCHVWMNSVQVYKTVPDIQSKVQCSLLTTFVISLLPNYIQTIYIPEGNISIYSEWMIKQNILSFNIFRWGNVKMYITVGKYFHNMYIHVANNVRWDCRFVYGFIFV